MKVLVSSDKINCSIEFDYPDKQIDFKEIKQELEKIGKTLFWDLNYHFDVVGENIKF